jgi:Zn-dependent protease/CBS domain-containing protein
VAGIEISIHATFLLLLVWVAIIAYQAGRTVAAVVNGIVLIIAVFATVVLHELAHALMAQRFGVPTRGITLLPIGGVSRLERIPRDPKQELLVAIVGPLVNVGLALVLYLILVTSGGVPSLVDLSIVNAKVMSRAFLAWFMAVNIWLAIFNLLPAFPMDGGRVLRALVALKTHNYAHATAIAARVGRVFALLFGLLGLFVLNNPFLVIIALFVWLGAAGEAAHEQTSEMLEGVTVPSVMVTDVRTLEPGDTLARAVQLLLAGFQQDFPVVDSGRVVGVLTRSALFTALAERGEDAPVSEAMRRFFQTVDPSVSINDALTKLKSSQSPVLPVVQGDQLIGVITTENVGEFVATRAAVRQ